MLELKIGTRGSPLSLAQTNLTCQSLEKRFPDLKLHIISFDTAGDIDKSTSLESEKIGDDFFTDRLDQAVLQGEVDAAFHSAKDLPLELNPQLDFFYCPWRADPRDAVCYSRPHRDLPQRPKVGISSPSRRDYCQKRWPHAELLPIRGNIDTRLDALDQGEFDIILLAAAGLIRLSKEDRIDEYLSLEDCPTHPDQGYLAFTFKQGDQRWHTLRDLMLKPVILAGAGTGRDGNYSVSVLDTLKQADIVLHDALLDSEILNHVQGEKQYAGARVGDGHAEHRMNRIGQSLVQARKKGRSAVRLKGGDPTLFGRLGVELDYLEQSQTPYRILPGIPWLCSAPIQHGILLTERAKVRHFHVATGTTHEGQAFDPSQIKTSNAPIYFFMATSHLEELSKNLIKEGWSPSTPAAIFRGERDPEAIVRGSLETISKDLKESNLKLPAMVLIGENARLEEAHSVFNGPLHGLRIAVPGSQRQRAKASVLLENLGAIALPIPCFELKANSDTSWIESLQEIDWITLHSPEGAEFFIQALKQKQFDLRQCPKISVSGPAVAEVLKSYGLYVDHLPEIYTSESMAESLSQKLKTPQKIMVLKSSASESNSPEILKANHHQVQEVDLYLNEPLNSIEVPECDAILFSSPSAVHSLSKCFKYNDKVLIGSIGPVTSKALQKVQWPIHFEAKVHNVDHLISALASYQLFRS